MNSHVSVFHLGLGDLACTDQVTRMALIIRSEVDILYDSDHFHWSSVLPVGPETASGCLCCYIVHVHILSIYLLFKSLQNLDSGLLVCCNCCHEIDLCIQ